MNIQWYPGHMTKARRMMQEDIKLIDIVIELVDSRIPFSSKNPDIDELAKNKYRLILLNKSDLADDAVTTKWENYYKNKGFAVAKINARDGMGNMKFSKIIIVLKYSLLLVIRINNFFNCYMFIFKSSFWIFFFVN